jgi:hypothetical protein
MAKVKPTLVFTHNQIALKVSQGSNNMNFRLGMHHLLLLQKIMANCQKISQL